MAGSRASAGLRFLHASDLHLEQPLHGIGSVPEHLADLFLDAPYLAAENVFDLAISEDVQFLLLSGDVIQPRVAGPRGLDFLLRQFRRLAESEIAVYWSRGKADRFEHWPASVPLPSNVVTLGDEYVDAVTHRREKQPIAVIQGRAAASNGRFQAAEFDSDSSLPTIVVVHGHDDVENMAESDIAYWALGGLHEPKTLCNGSSVAHYSGSPQGRRPAEEGQHGCSLVEIDSRGRLTRTTVPTDVVRWCNVEIELPNSADRSSVLRMLSRRTHQLMESLGQHQLLIRWILTDGDELEDTRSDMFAARLREGGLADDLLNSLRTEFGTVSSSVWHVEIDVRPPTVFPSGWYEENTILGDLLRAVGRVQEDKNQPLGRGIPDDAKVSDELAAALQIQSPAEREEILAKVAALGVDLLRGDRVLSEESTATASPAIHPTATFDQ